LKDVIVGKIYFLLVRIKIKHMELSIIRRETTGAVPNQYNESETITKFEIMDGAPVRGGFFEHFSGTRHLPLPQFLALLY
jgi:vacuolar protein sorting-associated protein 26